MMDKSNTTTRLGNMLGQQNSCNKPLFPNWLDEIIVPAIDLFYKTPKDRKLIQQDEPEPNIVNNIHSKMLLLFEAWQAKVGSLDDLNIDIGCELDIDKNENVCCSCFNTKCLIKNSECEQNDIIPDILIHCRESKKKNHVVIEFKKTSNDSEEQRDNDVAKLTYLTCKKSYYKYHYGYFIDLDKDKYKITPYINAKQEKSMTRKNGEWIE